MREIRRSKAKGRHNLDLCRCVGHVIRPAHDMGDAHICVIDHRGQCIQKLPILTDQNRVRQAGRVNRQIAQNAIRPLDPFLIKQEPPNAHTTLGAQRIALGLAQFERSAIIDGWLPHIQLFFALKVEFCGRFKRLVKSSFVAQILGRGLVSIKPHRLALLLIPSQAQPL